MNNAMTWQLLAVLLAAAFLGVIIGLSCMRLLEARRQKEAYNSLNKSIQKLTVERDSLNAEKSRMLQLLESEKKLGTLVRSKHSQMIAQQETLEVHTGLQSQRLAKLDAKLHAAEEKNVRLERDFASFKANKMREFQMLKANPAGWSDVDESSISDGHASIANEQDQLHSARSEYEVISADLTQPIIASELDIPSIAESELPDSVEELEFELAESDEQT